MSGNMRVSPLLLSAWLHIKQAAWIRWGRDRNFRINGPPLHKSLHVIPETICIHLASRISWSVSHYYPIYGMITGFDNTVTIKRCKQVAVQYILHVWIKNKLDCAKTWVFNYALLKPNLALFLATVIGVSKPIIHKSVSHRLVYTIYWDTVK